MKHIITLLAFLSAGVVFFARPSVVSAAGYGVHVLRPSEFQEVVKAFGEHRPEENPLYVTIPFALDDVNRLSEWQDAFRFAKQENIIPLVRLTTRFDAEKNAWAVPTRADIVLFAKALDRLEWPQEKRHVMFFNEPNHAAEWGGKADPESYAEVARFATSWFATEDASYELLPAALDLAAPNGSTTMEAFTFWRRALKSDPELFQRFTAWNSHSYPNPAFSAPPLAKGQNSLRGFEHELAFLKKYSDREWPVYITETSWRVTSRNQNVMRSYYRTARKQIWSHDQVVAVTPFVFAGSPGPFSEFSLVKEQLLTSQGEAFATLLRETQHELVGDAAVLQ